MLILLPLQNIIVSIRQLPLGSDFVDILLAVVTIVWASKSLGKREKIFENTSLNPVLFILIVFTYFSLWQGSLSFGLSLPVNISDQIERPFRKAIRVQGQGDLVYQALRNKEGKNVPKQPKYADYSLLTLVTLNFSHFKLLTTNQAAFAMCLLVKPGLIQ